MTQADSPKNFGAKGALNDTSLSLQEALTYALQDEYLAQARHSKVIAKFGEIRPFTQIKNAERRHISALVPLFKKYGIKVPNNVARKYIDTPKTYKDALQISFEAELDNIAMYKKITANSTFPSDVIGVMDKLANASQNHLAAFRRALEKIK
jgi:hypothetical protein